MRITVHVTPRASRDEIAGWYGGELSVKVTAPPEDGKANATVCALLAKAVGVPKGAVRVVRGQATRRKLIEMHGVGASDVSAVFGEPDAPLF